MPKKPRDDNISPKITNYNQYTIKTLFHKQIYLKYYIKLLSTYTYKIYIKHKFYI